MKKKHIVFVFYVLCFNIILAQNELFEQANTFLYHKEYGKSLSLYEKIKKKYWWKHSLYSKASYNIGYIYYLQKDHQNAKKVFQKILKSHFYELDAGGKGYGIMQEPYALYKYNSSKNLAEIALIEENYVDALKYTELFDKKYPYQHFCGNEMYWNSLYTAMMYGAIYRKLGQKDSALSHLLPLVIECGLGSNKNLVNLTIEILQENYSEDEIKRELIKAENSIYDENPSDWTWTTLFFNHKIEIWLVAKDYYEYHSRTKKADDDSSEFKIQKYRFQKSSFYQQIKNE